MIKRIFSAAIAGILLLSVLVFPAFAASERAAQCSVVTVGYFDFPGYHNRSEDGEKSGYGYEYLQELKKYANWKYEYVYAPYEECLKLLEEGKIDLLTSASYSASRDELFDFSEAPLGTKSTILTVKSTNQKYISGEYASFDHIRVGMLSGNTSNEKFDAFSKKHHFTYTCDDSYTNTDALWNALQSGVVDAIITSNLRSTEQERVIAEFAPSPYYAIVKEGNSKLLYELNTAMEKISLTNPTYQSALYQKYYGADGAKGVAFSLEEQAYLKKNPELSILLPPSLRPMAYSEEGVAKGIEPDLIRKALEPSGLKLNFLTFPTVEEYEKKKENVSQYPVIGLAIDDSYYAESNHLRLTAPYLTIHYNTLTKAGLTQNKMIMAAVKGEMITENYVEKHYSPDQIRYYPNGNECVEAVLNGEATHTIMNSYIAEYIIGNDMKNKLVSNALMDFHTNFAMSVHGDADYLLFSILNQCVNALSQDDVRFVLLKNTLYREKTFSLIEYLYLYPEQAILLVTVLFAVLIFAVVIAARQHQLKKEQLALQETAHFAKIATEANGAITELNMNTMRVTSYSFSGKRLVKQENPLTAGILNETTRTQIIASEHLAEYDELFAKENLLKLAGKDRQKSCTFRAKEKSGAYVWHLFTLQGIPVDALHPNNLMIFQKNIEAMKHQEELREQQMTDALNTARAASEAKGTFMSRMSHEIRTPLNAVIGYMTIAKSNTQNMNKVNDCIAKAEISAKHLLAIINDVLDMSSIESGKLKIAQTSFDFRKLIAEVSTIFYMQAQEKNVKFEATVNQVTEDFLIGDQLRVNQILLNLLSNAVKFTPKGGNIRFSVEQKAIINNKVFIRFVVADSGIGMTREFQEKLFTPFEQEDASIAQRYGGTGIGLSITKNLITMMNGIIEVESRQGVGTAFAVELPFTRDLSSVKVRLPSQDFSHVNALIVDDEQSTCEYMCILMRRCGVHSEYALCGEMAVQLVSQAHQKGKAFDLCLLDWKMPDMDGMETVKQIRACVGDEMPIIVVTAYDFSEIEESAKAAGVNLFITKPLFQSTMFDLLVTTYGKHTMARPEPQKERNLFTGKRLLLAEDNEMNREIAVEILTQYGFVMDCAENGKQALDQFEASAPGTYHALLMDVQMPVMNGYDATRAVRESVHPQAKTIPIIAMTANAFSEDIAASHAAGMNDHISKPIDVEQMLAILKKHVGACETSDKGEVS